MDGLDDDNVDATAACSLVSATVAESHASMLKCVGAIVADPCLSRKIVCRSTSAMSVTVPALESVCCLQLDTKMQHLFPKVANCFGSQEIEPSSRNHATLNSSEKITGFLQSLKP